MRNGNPYLGEIDAVLPRLLALYDSDPTSPTYGVGDRFYWAWKLIDFGNGTFQGAAHGLARLLEAGLLPDWLAQSAVLRRIDAMFGGAKHLTRKNGSLEEAFPYESSFCVTALVAYDLASTIDLLRGRVDALTRGRWESAVRPMVQFLLRADEIHGVISNHLATAAAALFKWSRLTGEPGEQRGRELLARIERHASSEGWLREYQGADPGYQSLCLGYLCDIHEMRPDLNLQGMLERSFGFLLHFVHPDGSFGGTYGSRNTRFYFPAGAEVLADEVPAASALAGAMRTSIAGGRTVTLAAMDEPNLVSMFNAYCGAAVAYERGRGQRASAAAETPSGSTEPWRKIFPEAGLLLDHGPGHHTIVSWHKGGVCYHFVSGELEQEDHGVVVESAAGKRYSTQAYRGDNEVSIDEDSVIVRAALTRMDRMLPTPAKFLVLRLLNLTLMRNSTLSNLVKRLLVRLLITGKRTICTWNRRIIRLGPRLTIEDRLEGDTAGMCRVHRGAPFSAIHMASQGYWQISDDRE